MDFTNTERDLLLAGLFELRINQAPDDPKGAEITALVVKLGGVPDTAFYGAYRDGRQDDELPVIEYPGDETDEG